MKVVYAGLKIYVGIGLWNVFDSAVKAQNLRTY
jgi:hypothetical protein